MTKRILYLILGTILASLGIASVLHCGLGAFSLTLANKAIAQWCGFDLAIANFLTELVMLLLAIYYKEGFGWTCLCSMTIGSFFTSLFDKILPYSPWLALLFFAMILGFALQGKAGFGGNSTNILMEALVKQKGKSLAFIRSIIDGSFLIIAWIAFPTQITIWTLVFTFGISIAIKYIYKLVKYEPTDIKHDYLIARKSSHGHL